MPEGRRHDPDELFVADPATFAEEPDEPEIPRWPSVVGAVSMIYGALGLGLGCLGLIASLRIGGGGMAGAASGPPAPGQLAQTGATLGWTMLLIVAGGLLSLRKPVGRTLHLIWAAGAVALVAWGLSVQMAQQAQMLRAMEQEGMVPEMTDLMRSLTPYTVGCSAIIGFAWPIFCLIWFGLVKRKPEDITGRAASGG